MKKVCAVKPYESGKENENQSNFQILSYYYFLKLGKCFHSLLGLRPQLQGKQCLLVSQMPGEKMTSLLRFLTTV